MILWALTAAVALLSPLLLLGVGLVAGHILEGRHLAALAERERRFAHIPIVSSRRLASETGVRQAGLTVGGVVVSADYFTRMVAAWRKLVGGEFGGYARLLERARREALLRMKEASPDADAYLGCRITTSPLSVGGGTIVCFEVMAYATAVVWRPPADARPVR